MKKLTFYTEPVTGGFLGRCNELASLSYGPKKNRDTALSGVKRLAKRLQASGAKAVTNVTKPKTNKKLVNRITFVIDRSGSMASVMFNAIKALNDNINSIRTECLKTGQEAFVSVIAFDTQIDVIRNDANVHSIAPITSAEVYARGSTALFDATHKAIKNMESAFIGIGEDVSYLIMTITDGEENASRIVNADFLKKEMSRVQATDRWTLTFLVPPGGKNQLLRMGIPDGNIMEWEATTRGVQTYAAQNTTGIGNYFVGRSMGTNSVKSFYTDLSNLTGKQVKSALADISALVKVLPVEREVDIKTFVEGKLGQYTPGSAFYQLTKDEKKVQDYKQLLVMEKGKKAVFGGPDARAVLGIPSGDLKIKPGNHGNFDIFVQSTSLNRKLVRGTKLLVKV